MKDMLNHEINNTKQFLHNNLKYCGFALGALDIAGSIVRINVKQDKIVCMYTIISEKYITYVVPSGCDKNYLVEMIEDSLNYKFTSGTVIGEYSDILDKYFDLPSNHMNEVASISNANSNANFCFTEHSEVKYLREEDIEIYTSAINTISEFKTQTFEEYKGVLTRASIVVVWENDKIIAGSTITSVSDVNAVITSVFVVDGYRRKGLARKCVETLLAKYLQNRTISIFFNNPNAKDLYLKLGFDINEKLIMFDRN